MLLVAVGAFLTVWLRYTSSISAVTGRTHFKSASEYSRRQAAVRQQQVGRDAGGAIEPSAAEGALAEQPTLRQHELHITVKPPRPLAPLLPAEPEVDAPSDCHARAHTELEGGVVQWGDHNRVSSAADCCRSCREHAKRVALEGKPEGRACNVWVFCADRELCGERHGQCWLKHALDPADPPSRGSGIKVPWTSGTVLPQPPESYRLASRMKRAVRQRAPLSMLAASELHVGLRNETGTIELLTPTAGDQPHFSFPLPLTDVQPRTPNPKAAAPQRCG